MLRTKVKSIIRGGFWAYISGLRISIQAPEVPFLYPKMATFGKSAHLNVPKNGTLSAQLEILRPLL